LIGAVRAEPGVENEGTGFGKEIVPQLQGDPAQGCRSRDLQGPAAQAASGLTPRFSLRQRAFSFKI
jgi:hypothetical protein